ncbi:MAG: carboxypeptidase-like regulatory domain-containing protein [Bacteroidales bacterium]
MLRNLLLTLALLLTANAMVFAQGQGALQGKFIDKDSKEPLAFVNIVVKKGGVQAGGATTDFDGKYSIKPLEPGEYTLEATFVGYNAVKMNNIIIGTDQTRFLDVIMASGAETLETVEIVGSKEPLIDKDQTSSKVTHTAKDIAKMPSRDIGSIAAGSGGVVSTDGKAGSVRGGNAAVTYVDGVRVSGSVNLPPSALAQVEVIISGLPAQYGDVSGAIYSITTKGPSRNYNGGIGFETSQFLDRFGFNRAEFSFSGPLLRGKKNKDNTSIIGFAVSGDITYQQDGAPLFQKLYKVKDSKINDLLMNPFRIVPQGNNNIVKYNAEYLTKANMERVNHTQNSDRVNANLLMNFRARVSKTINLTVGSRFTMAHGNNFSFYNSLMNYDKNSFSEGYSWVSNVKLVQFFKNDKDSFIKNFFYTLQFDYTYNWGKTYDPDHKQNIFDYGYYGKYLTQKEATYAPKSKYEHNGKVYENVSVLNSWDKDVLVEFTPMGNNPALTGMVNQYFKEFDGRPDGYYRNFTDLTRNNCPINGSSGSLMAYNLFYLPGVTTSGNSEYNNQQFAFDGKVSMTLGNHSILAGFEYRQNIYRNFSVSGTPLWTAMRMAANEHIKQLDLDNPIFVSHEGVVDTIKFNRKYDEKSQFQYSKNLRKLLGLPVDGLDFILTDSYDPSANTMNYYDRNGDLQIAKLNGDFGLDMFSADELINSGKSYVSYNGYNYDGSKQSGNPTLYDFLNEKDANGNYTRAIPAFRPTYMGAFIQDKFTFDDLIFNVGVRFERFDANQPVPVDPYIIYPYFNAGDMRQAIKGGDETITRKMENLAIPDNIPDGAAVYIDDKLNPKNIAGYRVGRVWYDANGMEIQDPKLLDKGNGVQAHIKDYNAESEKMSEESFEDYKPEWQVIPRVSFSFPISDEAVFSAHYDVYTERPGSGNIFSPLAYLHIQNSNFISNPGLKPEKTIDYSLGFQQKLTNNSSLKIEGYYREFRDMISSYNYFGAYPKSYTSYLNLNNGTAKGIIFSYFQRRVNNLQIRANYSLMFSTITNSNVGELSSRIAAGLPFLRATYPRGGRDKRHSISLTLDYRYGSGKDYNGPVIKREKSQKAPLKILENTGLSVTFTGGSGLPYSRTRNVVPASTDFPTAKLLRGTYNGSRYPWQFWMNAKLDKDFYFKKEGKRSMSFLNVYLQVENVLNSENIRSVYSYTGNPNDDGFLSAPEWQKAISIKTDEQSFRELYSIFVDNPFNYARPRIIKLGFTYNF